MPTTSTSTTTTISTSTSTTSTSTSTTSTSTSTTTTYLPYPDLKDSPVDLDLYPVSTAALPGAGNIIETTLSAGITIANPGVAATLQLTSTTNFPIYGFVVIQHNSTFEIVRYEGLDGAPVGVVVKERGYGSTSAMVADNGDKVWLVDASYYSDIKSAYLVRLMREHNALGQHRTDEIRAKDATGLKLYEDGGKGIFVQDATGNVGIGTTGPESLLELYSATGGAAQFRLSGGDVTHGMTTILPTNTYYRITTLGSGTGGALIDGLSDVGATPGFTFRGLIGVTDPTDTTPAIQFWAGKQSGTTSGALGSSETAYQFSNYNGGTDWLTILGNGNVGIGTAGPAQRLDVEAEVAGGGIAISSSSTFSPTLSFYDGSSLAIQFGLALGTNHFVVGASVDDFVINQYRNNDLLFATNDTERMRIDSSGNVGIGTTGPVSSLHLSGTSSGITVDGLSEGSYGLEMQTDPSGRGIQITTTDYSYESAGTAFVCNLYASTGNTHVRMDAWDVGKTSDAAIVLQGESGGRVGIGTRAPGQIFDINDGSGNMIADGYDNHPSFLADKVDPVPMSDVLTKFKQVIPYKYKRIPYVSAEELAEAGIEEFGQEKWEAAFPDGYRDKKLKHCPDEEIKTFLDNLADELRAERQEWPEYQRLHYSLALDDLADTFPDILSRNKDGDVTGYSLNNYVGLLHACITGLIGRVEQLEIGQ